MEDENIKKILIPSAIAATISILIFLSIFIAALAWLLTLIY